MNIIKPDHEDYSLLRYRTSLVGFYKNHPIVQYTEDYKLLKGYWIIDQEVYIRIDMRGTSNGWEWSLVQESPGEI